MFDTQNPVRNPAEVVEQVRREVEYLLSLVAVPEQHMGAEVNLAYSAEFQGQHKDAEVNLACSAEFQGQHKDAEVNLACSAESAWDEPDGNPVGV